MDFEASKLVCRAVQGSGSHEQSFSWNWFMRGLSQFIKDITMVSQNCDVSPYLATVIIHAWLTLRSCLFIVAIQYTARDFLNMFSAMVCRRYAKNVWIQLDVGWRQSELWLCREMQNNQLSILCNKISNVSPECTVRKTKSWPVKF